MPALQNLSFEIAGATPGSALGWTRTSQSSVLDIGVIESFESGWLGNEWYSPTITSSSIGVADGFESGWSSNEAYSPVITGSAAAVHDSGHGYEDFESGWSSNETYSPTITSSVAGAAEDFSTGWSNNQNYSPTIITKVTAAAEDFESVLLDQSFEVLGAPTDTMTAPGHVLVNGNVVYAQSTSSLPTGLGKLVKYFVVGSVSGVSFGLSLTSGGSAITVTDAGVGTHNTHGDEDLYWTVSLG